MIDRTRYKTGNPPAPGLYKIKAAGNWPGDGPRFSLWTGWSWCRPRHDVLSAEIHAMHMGTRALNEVRWKRIEVSDG